MTATEALEVVLVGDILVGLVDGRVDICGRDGDLGSDLIVLRLLCGDGDLQRSSSVSFLGGSFPLTVTHVARVACGGAGERTRTFTEFLPLEPKSSASTSSATPAVSTHSLAIIANVGTYTQLSIGISMLGLFASPTSLRTQPARRTLSTLGRSPFRRILCRSVHFEAQNDVRSERNGTRFA